MSYFIYNGKLITSSGKLINQIVGTTYEDWFLPSNSGILSMKTNLHDEGVGDFADGESYWSSSEHSTIGSIAAFLTFSPGSPIQYTNKDTTFYRVRAARSFSDSIGAYNLRDVGPAGGLIFAIDGTGTVYYEASPSDVSASSVWSNIASEIGTLGTTLGTGLSNSIDIVNQAGHTTSAANLCLELSISA